jgi:branched-chain amino acid transport system permease protein
LLWESLDLLISGLATGATYALVATGFTLLWQTSSTVNFAQGDFVTLPAFVIIGLHAAGLSLPLAMLGGLIVALVVLGAMFKLLLVDPLLRHGVLPLGIAAIALGVAMQEGTKALFGAEAYPFPGLTGGFDLGPMFVNWQDTLVIGVAVLAVTALHFFLSHTRTGRCMQATAQNPTVAQILGIPVPRMIMLTFLLNAALVTLAAILISPAVLVKFDNGSGLGLSAFCAAIIGGFNQVRGAIAGGLLLGVLENFAATYGPDQYRAAVPMVLLIAFVLFRPQGLLGRATERAV